MKTGLRVCLALAVAAGMIAGCGPRKPRESMSAGHARIGAADAVFDLAWFLSREFQGANPAAFIDIYRSPTRRLLDSLLNDRCEEIVLDRSLTRAESLSFKQAGLKLYTYPVAYYPVLLLASKDNPVAVIDSVTLRRIVSGSLQNWKILGGPNAEINLYLPLPGEGGWETLTEYFGTLDSVTAVVCSTSAAMLDSARDDPGALLVYSLPVGDLPYKPLRFLRNGMEINPSVKTILDSVAYPFRLDITYLTTRMKMDVAAGYLTFAVSNIGQRRLMDALRYRPASVPVRIIRMKN